MRSFIVMAMFTASLAHAGWSDYEEVRNLRLDSEGIESLTIEAGPGSMDVAGVAGADEVLVVATIVISDSDEDKALEVIEKRMQLSLEADADTAVLKSDFENGFMGWGAEGAIHLEVKIPQGMAVHIDDGSGSLDVTGTLGDVFIDDGSGSIDVRGVADVRIDDGSGSVDISDASGDVSVVDGSGSISVKHIGGSVTIDDGSGGIRVSDVENDLTIVDDGSGGLKISDVRGRVEQET